MRSKPRKERKRVKKGQFFFFSSRDTTNRNRTSEHSMLISPFYHKQIKSKVFSFRNVRTIDFERKLKPMIQTKQFQPRCCIAFSLFVGFRGTSCCFSFFVHFFLAIWNRQFTRNLNAYSISKILIKFECLLNYSEGTMAEIEALWPISTPCIFSILTPLFFSVPSIKKRESAL